MDFRPVFLDGSTTYAHANKLDILGSEASRECLRLSRKPYEKIKNWLARTKRVNLDAFLWLTGFLRNLITGAAAL